MPTTLDEIAYLVWNPADEGLNTDLCVNTCWCREQGVEELAGSFSTLTFHQIVFLMTLVTLFAPIAVGSSIGWVDERVASVDQFIVAPVWSLGKDPISYTSGLFMFDPLHIIGYLPVTFFGMVFGVLVIRYCQDKCSRRWVHFGAIASMAFPLFILAMKIPTYIAWHVLAYDGPVPIQLIVGLLLVRSHRVPGSDSPWLDEEKEAT